MTVVSRFQGRYVEVGGQFGELLRGGISSSRGEAAQEDGPFHVRKVARHDKGYLGAR